MSHDLLTTYSELADVIDNLPLIVREHRRCRRLSLRAAGKEVDMAASTLSRLEGGRQIDGRTLAAILRWLDGPEDTLTPPLAVSVDGDGS